MSHISYEWFPRSDRDKVKITNIVTEDLRLLWEVSIPPCGTDLDKRAKAMRRLEGLGNIISAYMASHPNPFPVERDGILGNLLNRYGFKDVEPLSFMAWNPEIEPLLFCNPDDELPTVLHHLETYVPKTKEHFAGAVHADEHVIQIEPAISDDDPTLSMGM